MSLYPGILIRTNQDDIGTIPRSQQNVTGCPDIIPWQNVPVANPTATFGTTDSYATNPGKDILYNNTNYIYVRGKNLVSTGNNGLVYLCYQPAAVVQWPNQWQQNNFLGGSVDPTQRFLPISANANGIGCTDAFVWLNPDQPPAGSDHYCLIAQCTAQGVTLDDLEAGWSQITTASGLAAWLATTGGVGWRNVRIVDSQAPTYSTWSTLSNGAQNGTYQAQLVCKNLPAGSAVAFSSPTANPAGIPIEMAQVTIPIPPNGKLGDPNPSFNASITTPMNANWQGTVYIQFYSNGYAYNPGALMTTALSFQFALQQTQADFYTELAGIRGRTLAELGGLEDNWVYYHPECGFMNADEALGPKGVYNFDQPGHHGGGNVELYPLGSFGAVPRPTAQVSVPTVLARRSQRIRSTLTDSEQQPGNALDTYNDIFIRDSLNETDNSLPRPPVTVESPDIIPWGTAKASDPSQLFQADYDQNPGRSLIYGATNYIYVRGKNYADQLSMGNVYLYYAYQTQLSQPKLWTQLSTAAHNNSSALASDGGEIAVTEDPFVWTPPRPSAQNPYVLIASIATNTYGNPVPAYDGSKPFALWDAAQGGVAARIIPVPLPPQPRNVYTFTALVELNNDAALDIEVSLLPTNGIEGDMLQFSFDQPGTTGPIAVGSTPITGSPGQTLSVDATIAPNYAGMLTCTYTAQPGNHLPFPTLALTIYSVTGSGGDGHHGGERNLTELVTYTLIAKSG